MKISDYRQKEFEALIPYYFNSAYFGPLPARTQKAGQQAIERFSCLSNISFDSWKGLPDEARQKLGGLLGVDPDFISHHSSVSESISYLSLGFDFKENDVVAVMDGDYPSNVLPWLLNEKKMKYKLEKLPPHYFYDLDLLEKNLPKNTRILNVSHVLFNTGRKHNLIEIGKFCQKRNILFVADISQSLGGLYLNEQEVEACDVLVGVTYKWLLGPYGHAFTYWQPRAIEKIRNTHLSWQTFKNGTDISQLLNYTTEPLSGARRFDRGQAPNIIPLSMTIKSLELLDEIGLENIQEYNQMLVKTFLENYPKSELELITPLDSHSNIVCLKAKTPSSSAKLEGLIEKHKIQGSIREGNLRFSFHLFNTLDEVNFLTQTLFDEIG